MTTDWMKFYERYFAQALNQKFQDLSEADKSLKKDGRSIVYIIDGLEEIFKMYLQMKISREQFSFCVRIL